MLLSVPFFIPVTNAQLSEPIFDIFDFGATGNGKTNDQKFIQMAIDACEDSDGTVYIHNGIFLTGQLLLKSNMTLFIDSTAVLLGVQSDSESAYPHHMIETDYPNRMKEDCQRRLIYGSHIRNVRITGGGIIDGQGDFKPWMNVKELGTEKDRPSILAFVGSEDITISGITILKPACWTQVYIECTGIIISNITVNTGNLTPNRDGIDIVDCHQVLIENCLIKSEDDGICFKSGSEFGCKNVKVINCIIDKLNVNAGNCFKLGTDGLGMFKDFSISGLTLKNASQNSAIAIESMDGAIIDNLIFTDCQISNTGQAFFILLADRRRTVQGRKTRIGTISNIHFKNITGSGFTKQYPSIITGIEGHHIQNVIFENIHFTLKGGVNTYDRTVMEYDGKYPEGSKFGLTNAFAFFVRHTDEVTFIRCEINTKLPDDREWLVTEDVGKITVK